MDSTLKAMLDEAALVAKRYARKCRWADVRDMAQEARVAVLDAYKRYDGKRSVTAYAGTVATYAVRAWLSNNVSAVNVSWRHRKEVATTRVVGDDVLMSMTADDLAADECLAREEGLRLTAERVAQLLAEGREAELAALVLMGQKSADVAAKADVPVSMVYRARQSLAKKLKHDSMLREAWESL